MGWALNTTAGEQIESAVDAEGPPPHSTPKWSTQGARGSNEPHWRRERIYLKGAGQALGAGRLPFGLRELAQLAECARRLPNKATKRKNDAKVGGTTRGRRKTTTQRQKIPEYDW